MQSVIEYITLVVTALGAAVIHILTLIVFLVMSLGLLTFVGLTWIIGGRVTLGAKSYRWFKEVE